MTFVEELGRTCPSGWAAAVVRAKGRQVAASRWRRDLADRRRTAPRPACCWRLLRRRRPGAALPAAARPPPGGRAASWSTSPSATSTACAPTTRCGTTRVTAWLLEEVRAGRTIGDVRFVPEPGRRARARPALGRVMGAEQSNTSVVFGEKTIIKLFRRLNPGVNPDLELHRALRSVGSNDVAALQGAVEGTLGGEPTTLGDAPGLRRQLRRRLGDGPGLGPRPLRRGGPARRRGGRRLRRRGLPDRRDRRRRARRAGPRAGHRGARPGRVRRRVERPPGRRRRARCPCSCRTSTRCGPCTTRSPG